LPKAQLLTKLVLLLPQYALGRFQASGFFFASAASLLRQWTLWMISLLTEADNHIQYSPSGLGSVQARVKSERRRLTTDAWASDSRLAPSALFCSRIA